MTQEVSERPERTLGWRIGWTVAGLIPFAAVSAVQLATKFTNDAQLDAVTKALEIPTLAIAVCGSLLATRRKPRPVVIALLFVGLALSWVGDVVLDTSLTAGLAGFLAAHVIYIALFTVAFRGRRASRWSLLAILWFVGLLAVLGPNLGGMLPLVALYGAILGLMAAWSTRGNVLTVIGALLFVASDSLLAVRLYTPWLQDDVSEFLVMLAYLGAQLLIAAGVLRSAQERDIRSSGSPVSSSMVCSPSLVKPQRS